MARILSVLTSPSFYSGRQMETLHDDTELSDTNWRYQKRGPRTGRTEHWTLNCGGRWPSRTGFITDPAAPVNGILSRDLCCSGPFSPWSYGNGGSQSLKFIAGQCLDSGSTPVPNAVVQCFLAADDSLQRETQANADGYYEAGTDKAGQAHYLVAYKPGSPDIAGTTVNTLTPLNRDGT